MYSNLGNLGPNVYDATTGASNPPDIRFANVGVTRAGEAIDLVVSNETEYVPYTVSWNQLDDEGYAHINLNSLAYVTNSKEAVAATSRELLERSKAAVLGWLQHFANIKIETLGGARR